MPFRCKCGRTFEKPDSFSTHTSACAPFHRRMSSSTTTGDTSPPSPQTMTSLKLDMTNLARSFTSGLLSGSPVSPQQQSNPSSSTTTSPCSGTSPDFMPNFMPTALSLHNAFEGVRRRSMSYGQAWK